MGQEESSDQGIDLTSMKGKPGGRRVGQQETKTTSYQKGVETSPRQGGS